MYTLAVDAFVETGCSRSAAFGASAFVTAVRAAGGGGRGRISSATVADVVRHAGRRLGLLTDVFSFFSHRSLASSLHLCMLLSFRLLCASQHFFPLLIYLTTLLYTLFHIRLFILSLSLSFIFDILRSCPR